MSSFTQQPWLEPSDDGKNWIVKREFFYYIDDMWKVHVAVGFKTDFASVPRIFWNIFPPYGKYTNAALVHDKLYKAPVLISDTMSVVINRAQADKIFLDAMKVLRVSKATRSIMYRFIRIFGQASWDRYRNES